MEAAAEGAVGLSEARDGSPLSVAAASDDGDTVVGVSYGIDAADMGTVPDNRCEGDAGRGVHPERPFPPRSFRRRVRF